MKEIFTIECPIRNEPVALSDEPFGLIPNWLEKKKSYQIWNKSLRLRNLKPRVSIIDRVNDCDYDLQFEMYLGLFQSWNIQLMNFSKDTKQKVFDFKRIYTIGNDDLGLIDGIGHNSLNLEGVYKILYEGMKSEDKELLLELFAFYELRCLGLVGPNPQELRIFSITDFQNKLKINSTQLLIESRIQDKSHRLFSKIPSINIEIVICYLNHLFWINASPIIINLEIWDELDSIYKSIGNLHHYSTVEVDRLFKKYQSKKCRSKALLKLKEGIDNALSIFKDSDRIDITYYTNYAFNIVRSNDYRFFISTKDDDTKKKTIDYAKKFFQFCRIKNLSSLPLSEKDLVLYLDQCLEESHASIENYCFHIYLIESVYCRFGLDIQKNVISTINNSFLELKQSITKSIHRSILTYPLETVDDLRDKCILTWALSLTKNPIDKYLIGSILKSQVKVLDSGCILIKDFNGEQEILFKAMKNSKLCPVKAYLDYKIHIPKGSPIFSQHVESGTLIGLNPREIESIYDKWLDQQISPNLDFLYIKDDLSRQDLSQLPYYYKISREIEIKTIHHRLKTEPDTLPII